MTNFMKGLGQFAVIVGGVAGVAVGMTAIGGGGGIVVLSWLLLCVGTLVAYVGYALFKKRR